MNSDPRHEGPYEGKAVEEPTGIPKIVDEIVEHVEAAVEHVEHVLAPVPADASHQEPDEAEAFDSLFTRHQCEVLRDLLRLHRSLRGPQALLERAGHFTRPPFPPPPKTSDARR
jgi:hypothetical protein